MKKINSKLKTGDTIFKDNISGIVGLYYNGKIKITWKISETSSISEFITTKAINKMIECGEINVNIPYQCARFNNLISDVAEGLDKYGDNEFDK